MGIASSSGCCSQISGQALLCHVPCTMLTMHQRPSLGLSKQHLTMTLNAYPHDWNNLSLPRPSFGRSQRTGSGLFSPTVTGVIVNRERWTLWRRRRRPLDRQTPYETSVACNRHIYIRDYRARQKKVSLLDHGP